MATITRKSLWVDANQGTQEDGRAFGFVGTNATDDYQGWFFSWPGERATVTSEAEIEAIIDSMETDSTRPNDPEIPYRFAEFVLRRMLHKRLAAHQRAAAM